MVTNCRGMGSKEDKSDTHFCFHQPILFPAWPAARREGAAAAPAARPGETLTRPRSSPGSCPDPASESRCSPGSFRHFLRLQNALPNLAFQHSSTAHLTSVPLPAEGFSPAAAVPQSAPQTLQCPFCTYPGSRQELAPARGHGERTKRVLHGAGGVRAQCWSCFHNQESSHLSSDTFVRHKL